MVTPGRIVTFAPIQAPSSIIIGECVTAPDLFELSPVWWSVVIRTTWWPIPTLEPIVIGALSSAYSGELIRLPLPIVSILAIGRSAVKVSLPRTIAPFPILNPAARYNAVRTLLRELCGRNETKNWTNRYRGWIARTSSDRTRLSLDKPEDCTRGAFASSSTIIFVDFT